MTVDGVHSLRDQPKDLELAMRERTPFPTPLPEAGDYLRRVMADRGRPCASEGLHGRGGLLSGQLAATQLGPRAGEFDAGSPQLEGRIVRREESDGVFECDDHRVVVARRRGHHAIAKQAAARNGSVGNEMA